MSPVTKKQGSAVVLEPHAIVSSPIFSHVTTSSGPSKVIITAGQIGSDKNGVVPEDLEEQITQAFNNLKQCLEAAGATVQDVLKLTYYIVNYDHKNRRHTKPLQKFLGSHRPATTLVPVPALAIPEYKFEVEATAAIPQYPPQQADVIVVGAGLSGLQAARDIQKAGYSCIVLEARDRVGGKTWSRDSESGKVDVGAAWINDTNQSKIFNLAKRYNLDIVTQNTTGNIVIEQPDGSYKSHIYGGVLTGAEDKEYAENMVSIRDSFEELCQQIDIKDPVGSGLALGKDYDGVTLEEFIRSQNSSAAAMNTVKIWTRAMLGLEPHEMSALYFLDYCKSGGGLMQMRSDMKDGGQYMRIVQGTQSFSQGLASELTEGSVVFNSPVREIRQLEDSVVVTSARGTYRCLRVVISVPTPLYKEITFNPPLPAAKQQLSTTSKLGTYCKSILVYSSPWWRKSGLCGLLQSPIGPSAVTRDTSIDEQGHYSLTCFIVGQPARDWADKSPAKRQASVLDQIRRVYGAFATVEEPIEIVEQIWPNEQWSQGCPCPALPVGGLTNLGHVLRAPYGKLHFVGTETAYEWKGYMDGAVRSGERGAEEVITKLGRAKL